MRKKLLPALVLALAATAALAGGKKRIGLVFDVGGLGDKSFNDAANRGLEKAKKDLGIDAEYKEPGEGNAREGEMRRFATKKFDLVFGIGFLFTDDITNLAKKFKKVHWACVDYSVTEGKKIPENLLALKFKEQEGSFLVGALAALVSKSGKVGFVGGMNIPLIRKFEAGYKAGAKHANPKVEVIASYAGNTGEAFKNPTKGKELALAQIDQGVDVIFHASGSTGLGVFEACRDRKKQAIGVDSDQWDASMPEVVLTSMVKHVEVAVYEAIRAEVEGKFAGGVRELGLAEGGVDYVYDEHNKKLIPDDVRAKVEELRKEIIAGKIKVPFELDK